MSNTFKPETAALLLIDHQVGTMQLIKSIVCQSLRLVVTELTEPVSPRWSGWSPRPSRAA